MASRHQRIAPVYEYFPYNLTVATQAAGKAIGAVLDTTSTTTVAVGIATITLATINSNVTINSRLAIYGGTGTAEVVQVTGVNQATGTVTAIFANTHSGTYSVTLITGAKLGMVCVNTAGTAMVLTLWSGIPGLATSTKIHTPILTAGVAPAQYFCACDQGLFVVYTGTTAGDITITALADPI